MKSVYPQGRSWARSLDAEASERGPREGRKASPGGTGVCMWGGVLGVRLGGMWLPPGGNELL